MGHGKETKLSSLQISTRLKQIGNRIAENFFHIPLPLKQPLSTIQCPLGDLNDEVQYRLGENRLRPLQVTYLSTGLTSAFTESSHLKILFYEACNAVPCLISHTNCQMLFPRQ